MRPPLASGCNAAVFVRLLAKIEIGKHLTVTLDIDFLEVVQDALALTDQHHQTATRVLVLRMLLEMTGKISDPAAEQGNLHFRFSGIRRRITKLSDNLCFVFFCQTHDCMLEDVKNTYETT